VGKSKRSVTSAKSRSSWACQLPIETGTRSKRSQRFWRKVNRGGRGAHRVVFLFFPAANSAISAVKPLQALANERRRLVQNRRQECAGWFVVQASTHQSHWLRDSQTFAKAPAK